MSWDHKPDVHFAILVTMALHSGEGKDCLCFSPIALYAVRSAIGIIMPTICLSVCLSLTLCIVKSFF